MQSWGAPTNDMATRSWVTTNFSSFTSSVSNVLFITNLQSSGCYTYSQSANLTNSTTATNAQITAWTYSNSYANIVLTNGGFMNLTSGKYMFSFGSAILTGNSDTSILALRTNNTEVAAIKLSATMGSTAAFETGFKKIMLDLPTNCVTTLMASNSAASLLRLQNICFTVEKLQ